MRKKTLVKVPLKEKYLKNSVNERVLYLDLSENYANYSMDEDIKNGGVQYKPVAELARKKKVSRVITVSADSQELGLMAITYLAMELVKRRGGYEEHPMFEYMPDELETSWMESGTKIPVVSISEMMVYMRNDDLPFESNGFLMAQSQARNRHQPYWKSCKKESVCVIVNRNSIDSASLNYINLFSENRNVFVLFLDKNGMEAELIDDLPFGCMDSGHFNALKNNFILSNASDAVEVSLGEEENQLFYKYILKQNIAQRGLRVVKGFSYVRIVNLAMSINKDAVCEMLDKVVSYALKDLEDGEKAVLSNKSFDFVDQFMREKDVHGQNVDGKKLMEKNLVGMEDIKQQVYDIVNVMKYNKLRGQMNITGSKFHNVHVMLGAPGTAKTTVAKYMGQMMFNEKLLPDNRFVCINGAELKGMYVGHSAPKTKALFTQYDVIIIDEAYSIVESDGGTDSFGNEAIAQLIIELENHSTDKLVIFAGYGGDVEDRDNRMQAFLDSNPGIKSRITSTFYFKSYSAKEMAVIFERIAKNSNYELQPGTNRLVESFFRERVSMKDFGNGREARVLLETAVIYAAKRTMAEGKDTFTPQEMRLLAIEDIKQAMTRMSSSLGSNVAKRKPIGFAC